jgi:hypothetical protein
MGYNQQCDFQPLTEKNHIHILVLHRNDSEDLEGELIHQAVHGRNFTALSYAWGSLKKSSRVHIRCGNGEGLGHVRITQNLHDALHDIQNSNQVDPKRIFAGQVCVQQCDKKEVSHQVFFMGTIYKICQSSPYISWSFGIWRRGHLCINRSSV